MLLPLQRSFISVFLGNGLKPNPNISTAICKIQSRDIYLGQCDRKSIEEKLGLPQKPKKPLSAYALFMSETHSDVIGKNPKLKPTEVMPIIAKMWHSLDDSKKQKYVKESDKQKAKYSSIIMDYNENLTEKDKQRIEEMKSLIAERKEILSRRKKVQELGKPKKLLTPFVAYLQKHYDRGAKETHIDFLKRVSSRWRALSEAEKEKYKPSAADKDRHEKQLKEWEAKMIESGNYDVIRSKSRVSLDKSKRKSKSTSE